MLKLKLQYFWPPDVKNWLIGKDPDAGKDWEQEEKGVAEDETVGWHHWLNEREFEQVPGAGEGQRSLVLQSMGLQKVEYDWVTKNNNRAEVVAMFISGKS